MAGRARTLTLKTKVEVTGADKLNNLGQKLSTVGKNLTIGVTLPLVAAGTAAFKFASDLDEASSKAEQVFGDAAKGLRREAQSLGDAMSEATFLDTAGTFGALLDNMGFVEDEAADLSVAWIRLAEDMGSFHNQDPTEALGAIQSALSGEFEPLKRFGVMLNVATIEAKAMEMGLWDGTGALDAQTRALVVNAELFAQQGKVLGDFERTQDGAANATRILVANFEDAAASLGDELLPLGTELLKTVNGWVKAFKDLSPETKGLIVRIAGIAAAAGPLLFVFGKLLSSVKLFIAAGHLVHAGWRNIPTLMGFVDLAVAKAGAAFATTAATARSFASLLLGPIGIAITAFTLGFATDFLGMRTRFERDMKDIGEFLGDAGDAFRDFFGIVEDTSKTGFRSLSEEQQAAVVESGRQWQTYNDQISAAMYGPDGAVPTITGATDDMAGEAGELPGEMADAMLAAQFQLGDAISELVAFMDQALSPAQEIFAARSFLASKEYALALTSNNPLIRQKAAEMGAAAQEVLDRLDGSGAGARFVTSFATAIERNAWRAVNVTSAMAAKVMGIMPRSEPKDPNSPFRGITKGWGFGETLARGLLTGRGAVSGAFRDLVGGGIGGFGTLQPIRAAAGGSGGPTIVNNNFTFHGASSGSPNELSSLLQSLTAVSGGDVRYG